MRPGEVINVIICGVGGQGNVLAAQIIARAAIEEGLLVTIGETFGASQRGGAVQSHVRISKDELYGPLIPNGMADIIVGLEPLETLRVVLTHGNPDTVVLSNERPVYPIHVLAGKAKYPHVEEIFEKIRRLVGSLKTINATEIAREVGSTMFQNMVMIGFLIGNNLLPLGEITVENEIRKQFPEEKERENNLMAFRKGVERSKMVS